MKGKLIGVDLDCTLATYDKWRGLDHIGQARPGAKWFCETLRDCGLKVIVFTSRTFPGFGRQLGENVGFGREEVLAQFPMIATPQELADHMAVRVAGWLVANEIPYDSVWTGIGKPPFSAIVDDRGVSIPPNPDMTDFTVALGRVLALVEREI